MQDQRVARAADQAIGTSEAEDLCRLGAVAMADMLRRREISATELITAHLSRIDQVNPGLNALVTITGEQALAQARLADGHAASGELLGPLHGLPVAHKDLQDTRGVRTTYGSKVFAEHVPDSDSLLVQRMAAAGAISLGKTNTPEFGTGSQTYNEVFGPTRNPYDPTMTSGGSSGGAAAALATGMVALADGSDMAGSLRNPASFCGVVGLRPSAGRVPVWPTKAAWFSLSVDGPMARNVEDVALLLSVLAGDDPRSPLVLEGDAAQYARPLGQDVRGWRVAWSRHLGGLAIDPEITEVLERDGRPLLESLGCVVTDREPDLTGAERSFRVWRAWYYALEFGEHLDLHRDVMNPDVIENIEYGRTLTGQHLAEAEVLRSALWQRASALMTDYDVLAAPVVQVPPFPVEQRWVRQIAGQPQETYLDWMRSAYWISATGLPAISVPCGLTSAGLPVGIQFVGRPRGERALLEFAHAFEQMSLAARPPTAPGLSAWAPERWAYDVPTTLADRQPQHDRPSRQKEHGQ